MADRELTITGPALQRFGLAFHVADMWDQRMQFHCLDFSLTAEPAASSRYKGLEKLFEYAECPPHSMVRNCPSVAALVSFYSSC